MQVHKAKKLLLTELFMMSWSAFRMPQMLLHGPIATEDTMDQ